MPTYQVTDPTTGRKLRLTGDSPPTEAELEQIFATLPPSGQQIGAQDAGQIGAERDGGISPVLPVERRDIPVDMAREVPERGFAQRFQEEVIEPTGALVSGALAEIPAGLAGIAATIPGRTPEEAAEAGVRAIEETREALTFVPPSEAGREVLGIAGEAIAPVGEALKAAETFLGDEVFEATGSPALAAAATTIPTALIEGLGFASVRGGIRGLKRTKEAAKSKEITKAVVESAPEIEQIKNVSRGVYNELDNLGVVVKPKAITTLVKKIKNITAREGIDPGVTPQSVAVMKRLESEAGKPKTLTQIDTLYKVAQGAANATDLPDARIGAIILDNIDSFLDDIPTKDLKKGAARASEIGPKYRVARELWGRARRSELIARAMEKAEDSASGFQNGLVTQFRQILASDKKIKYFKPKEIQAMRDLVRGDFKTSLAKFIGRMGITEGQTTSFLGASVGAAGGAATFGPVGAVAFPAIGQISKKLAQKLTVGKAEFADAVVRAGTDADQIAAEYIRRVPKAQRSAAELSELLSRPDISLGRAIESSNKLISEAAEIGKGRQILNAVAVTMALGAPGAVKELEEQP